MRTMVLTFNVEVNVASEILLYAQYKTNKDMSSLE